MAARDFDVVLLGATGFTGKLVAHYLARRLRGTGVRWAMAGRDRGKLAEVRGTLLGLDPSRADLPLLHADVTDAASLAAMAASTRVVLTTVGPFERHGEPVVAACVEGGADYVDITGEPAFVAHMLSRYDEVARVRGVRIVHCCGFDSVPHDLGAYFTARQLPADAPMKIEAFVRARGRFSGGTFSSALLAFAHPAASAEAVRSLRATPPPGRHVHGVRSAIHHPPFTNGWAVPLPTIDPLIVLRSAAAIAAYGPDFRYGHYALFRSLTMLAATAAGLGAVAALAPLPPARALLARLRPAGTGPSDEERARGRFEVTFVGEAGGVHVTTRVSGGDPGYDETSKMCAESALCLAHDRALLPDWFGVLTPAAAMAEPLLARLRDAGIAFETLERTER